VRLGVMRSRSARHRIQARERPIPGRQRRRVLPSSSTAGSGQHPVTEAVTGSISSSSDPGRRRRSLAA
jgi:hypothetical protein